MKESGRNQQTERRDERILFYFAAGNWEIWEQLEYKGFKVGETTSMKEQRKNWGWVCSKAFRLKRLVLEAPCPERGCKVAVFITFLTATENDSRSNTISRQMAPKFKLWNELLEWNCVCGCWWSEKRGWKANKNVQLPSERPKLRSWSETVVVALKDKRFLTELLCVLLLSVFLQPRTTDRVWKGLLWSIKKDPPNILMNDTFEPEGSSVMRMRNR